jgi:hypothetical protein
MSGHCLERILRTSGEKMRDGNDDLAVNALMAKRKAVRGASSLFANQACRLLTES